jgi:2-keto-3-deoxy-L-rhamnonate aldolase RhmA
MAAGTRYAEARGVSGLVRAAGYGDTGAGWKERADASVGCIVQIERASALAGVDEIAALDAVDAVLVGPNDLANDLGCEPVLSDPRLQDALRAVAAAAERHGKTAGLYLPDVRGAREWYREGFNLLSASFDSKLLRDASTAVASLLRTAVEP